MSDDSPPPYSVVAAPLEKTLDSEPPEIALPFSHPDRLAVKILTLISEGKTLDSHFKDVRDLVAGGPNFERQEHAIILSQKFEILIWDSRRIAGAALVVLKDFNELVLNFLSNPDVAVQDRIKELANASRLLQQERDDSANQRIYFDALIKKMEEFHQMVHSEMGTLNPKRRRQSYSGDSGSMCMRPSRYETTLLLQGGAPNDDTDLFRKFITPFSVPRSEPVSGLSAVTAFIGVFPRRLMDYTQQFERVAEQTMFPSWILNSQSEAPAQLKKDTNPCAVLPSPPPGEHKRLCFPIEHANSTALPGLVDALLRDLRAFVSQADVFHTVFSEMTRVQDIFIVYLKDGQSIADQGYRSEIHRLRRHIPYVCNALDAYSKARLP